MGPTPDDLFAARDRIASHVHRTPVLRSRTFDQATGSEVCFKAECFQRVGAFKFRGACNAVFSLDAGRAARGVVTHSSGNHAQALALAARLRGIPASIVMPENASAPKRAATLGYGARVVSCAPTLAAREKTTARVLAETGGELVHPYDDPRVIAGQGTAALELLEEAGPLDLLLVPLGGGGLLAGTLLACAALSPATRVIGIEPAGADDGRRSLELGRIVPSIAPTTIADGLLTSLGELNFEIIRERVHAIVTVDEPAILRAMRLVWERIKILIEPSAAVPVAALLEGGIVPRGSRVGVILSGGNVDLDALPW
jgi:threonine dehydratase